MAAYLAQQPVPWLALAVLALTPTPADLASFHAGRSAWIAEAGTYTVRLAASARDGGQAVTFDLPREIVVERVRDVLGPAEPLRELTPRSR